MERSEKSRLEPALKKRIQELIALQGGGANPDLVEDIIANALEGLNEDFGDIISGEKFQAIEATRQEREEDDCLGLGRIAFGFDRRQYGRLRQLIDVLNSF